MKKFMVSILAALGLGMSSCAQNENIQSVGADQFEQSIVADSVQLVDVRTAEEYAEGHIAYAENNDVQQPTFKAKALQTLQKDKPVYVYCRSGKRSLVAANILAEAGFKVVNLRGGIMEWADGGKPVNR
ncbi:MAG: rhodanese-like domain-containing protein [Prevotella sp.]|nr:rhodanese-like domain-containing protein [Prevotella sp.]